MTKAVCFDFDGTLAHYDGDFDALLEGLRFDLGLMACDFATFRSKLTGELAATGAVTLSSALEKTLAGLELEPPAYLLEVAGETVERYARDIKVRSGAAKLLERLAAAGLRLALVTNGPADMQRAALAATRLEGHFDAVLASGDEDVGVRKPDPRIFEMACSRLRCEAASAVMVGDDLAKDITGALAAGLSAIRLGEGGPGHAGAADLDELERLLLG